MSDIKQLLWLLTNEETFIKLRAAFKEIENQSNTDGISKDDFLQIVGNVLQAKEEDIMAIFHEIDCDEQNKITWDAFLDYNLRALRPTTARTFDCGEVQYMDLKQPKLRMDAIVKIVLLESDAHFTYAMLSKYGRVCLYDSSFTCVSSYMAVMRPEDQFRSETEVRRRNRWLTDAIFMHDVQMLVVVASTRCMTIYDVSGLRHLPVWHIASFPNIIQVIKYCVKESDGRKLRTLILGDNFGEIKLMTFVKSSDDLLQKKHPQKMSVYYYQELANHKDYVRITSLGRVHSNAIISLDLLEGPSDMILSCSKDRKRSLVVSYVGEKSRIPSYSLAHFQGISCFAFSHKHKQLITGDDDGVLRIYSFHKLDQQCHSVELFKTTSSQSGLLTIVLMESLNVFLICDRSGTLKFYNLNDFTCVHVIQLNFDLSSGKKIEWSNECIYPGPKRQGMSSSLLWERNCFLVTCCNSFAKIDMFYLDGKNRQLHGNLLRPQPLQNSVLIPKDWEQHATQDNNEPCKETRCMNMSHLDFILKKDVLVHQGGVHTKIAFLEERKARMRWAVEHCAPFLALDLYPVEEIQLSLSLPVISSDKKIADRTRQLLEAANLRTIAFSELSSSGASSSQSARQ